MQTDDQVLKERIGILGEEFGSIFHFVYNETVWLNYKWIEFEELYGKKQSRIDLLNVSAPFFFFIVQKVLWDNIILGIARITDQSETFGKKNLTIQSIPAFVEDETFKETLNQSIKSILLKSSFCRTIRNKAIAHIDYDLFLNKTAYKIEESSRLKVKTVLQDIFHFINLIEIQYFNSETLFKLHFSDKGALSLLHMLDDGLSERQRLEARLRNDEFDESDLKFREI
jgi:hypothetical protein